MRILLVEDDITIADHCNNGIEGLNQARSCHYDAGIIDIMLPGLDGLSIIESLRKDKIPLPITILSAKRSIDDRVRGLQQGGDDYLTKPFSFCELLARIQALIRRTNHDVESTSLSVGQLTIALLARTAVREGKKISLQRMLANLLDNAIKYTPPTGKVQVELARTKNTITLSVKDNDIGIPKAAQGHIFKRFFRVDQSRTGDSCGVGLSFAQAVARAHGGEISLFSEPGKGSLFTISLPAP